MVQVETAGIDKVRHLIMQVVWERPISEADAESARGTIRTICGEASLNGLSTAEVLKAIFKPVLEPRSRGCNCPACQAHRDHKYTRYSQRD
jgi:hypothetical protein